MDNEIGALFLRCSSTKLEQMTGFLTSCLNRLSDDQVWKRDGAHENTVGNLILHLCGNMRQWIMHGVGGAADVRLRDKEFSADGGMTVAELIALFEETVRESRSVIDSLAPEKLVEKTVPQGREVTKLEAIYQVVGHVQQHVGQIILLTKQICRTDLDLTMPRPR
ncbi:DinB family protein [Edaphobacter modestus]|uniref:Putative damage-inducible protein DinB n=1 Tax=Edaphobacter modestus TaxID=388466 RepID=A0A4Q7YRB6_9BACT|nr:DinB family protein [Edaphobacter modestus]RZU39453.1 putative damage-inducible protein DinB [Edaphobacter modestus]